MEALEAILTRRSIRQYAPQAVPEQVVRELLAAAMQAPSAGNQQPWHFVVVTGAGQRMALAGALPHGQMLKTAPLGIAVCVGLETLRHPGFWVQDCSAATQNLLVAAHALGLGGVWLGVYPIEERVQGVQRVLGLPAQVVPLCVLSLGYPAARPEPPVSRYDEARVHLDRW
ncbi:MAG TPA: nitroreductase family protein [Anaerolineae bacterium]|nr:nitroreductase family protein [Anaerolineae bacterium]